MRTIVKTASLATLTLVALGLILSAGAAAAPDPKFTTIDVPGAVLTNAYDINSEGDIVGLYTDAGNKMHGFMLSNGNFNVIDFPGSTMTHAYGINPRVDIVGDYKDAAGNHGFLLRDGVFTSIDVPGASSTTAWGIGPKKNITGTYKDASGKIHAFLLNKQGEFSTLDPPFSFAQAQTHGVNARGDAVGCWWDGGGMMHSLLVREGEYITNDFPDSKMSMNWRINPEGWVVGHYTDLGNKTHGYQARGSRKYTTIDFPDAAYTEAHGINDSKEVVGMYKDASNKTHGFLRTTE